MKLTELWKKHRTDLTLNFTKLNWNTLQSQIIVIIVVTLVILPVCILLGLMLKALIFGAN